MFATSATPPRPPSFFRYRLVRNAEGTRADCSLISSFADVVAAFATIGAGYISDRFQKRGIFVIAFSSVGILGFIMNIATRNPHVRYAGVFLGAIGICRSISVSHALAACS